MLRRSRSPSKGTPTRLRPPSLAKVITPSRQASPTRPQSIHFTNDVYVAGSGIVPADRVQLPTDSVTRAEFFDVVLESDEEGADLLSWLGNVITSQGTELDSFGRSLPLDSSSGMTSSSVTRTTSSGSINAVNSNGGNQATLGLIQAATPSAPAGDPARFDAMLMELVETERSYVRRLDVLYHRYAQPLRQLSRHRENAVVPVYEAQRLFGNVGELLGANMAFLREMESLLQASAGGLQELKDNIGTVLHNHMACFSCYNEYFSNFEKAKHIEQNMSRNNRAFKEFAEGVKNTCSNLGNVSIRELIMEPVQRIPRYKLFLDGLVKALPADNQHQRPKLESAIVLCSKIANCEIDEKTQRAAVLWSFGRNVQGFPAGLFSVHRRFIDCIDVDDFPLDGTDIAAGTEPGLFSPVSASAKAIPCTLFLFDDALLVAKRQGSHLSGRQLLGLDNLDRLADEMKTYTEKSGTANQSMRKSELSFRGVSDIMDVLASDLGGPDFQLCLKKAPAHIHHAKWNARPLRQFSALANAKGNTPPRFEKIRFLENLWRAQALFKTGDSRSYLRTMVVPATQLSGNESPGADEAEPRRLIHWNIYQRAGYTAETSRSAVVLHVNPSRLSETLPRCPTQPHYPLAQLQIHSINEKYAECVYSIKRDAIAQDDDEYVLPLGDLTKRMRRLHESLALQEDNLPQMSLRAPDPSGASASHRGRVAAGLENFGRSLLNGTPESIRFGSPRRKGSILSRSSVATSLVSDVFSNSGRSVSTAGTSVNSRDMLSMAHPSPAVDGTGKLLPPVPSAPRSSVGRHHRAISAGTMDLVMNKPEQPPPRGQRPMSSVDYNAAQAPSPRRSIDAGCERRARAQSVGPSGDDASGQADSSLVWNRGASRPSGPRAAPPSSPRRKAVPSYPENESVSYTPTRRVPSASKRPAPVDDADGQENEGRCDARTEQREGDKRQHANKRPAYGSERAGDTLALEPKAPSRAVATAAPEPEVQPLQPRKQTSQNLPRHLSSIGKKPESGTLRGRVHRHIARLDEVDRESLDALTALAEEVSELQGAASELPSPLLGELVNRMENWIADASDRSADCKSSIARVAGDVEALLRLLEQSEHEREELSQGRNAIVGNPGAPQLEEKVQKLERQVRESGVFKTRCEALQRKCELLTALEKDGRLENGELHKAFNEELDRMYDDASLPSRDEEVEALRREVKRTKAQRNDLQKRNWEMERDTKIQKGRIDSYEKILREHGLL
ncbi:unnamed protein product [Parajaminaea phylloscopi]